MMSNDQLELEVSNFCSLPECPKVIREEYLESQSGDESDTEDEDAENENNEPELLVEPEPVAEDIVQDEWMGALKPIHAEEEAYYEAEQDYDDIEFQEQVSNTNWSEDVKALNLTSEDLHHLPKWLEETKASYTTSREDEEMGGLPDELNEKQFYAFAIVQNFVKDASEKGLKNVPQLLLNISGAAGTGKTFWLNTVKRYASSVFSSGFVTAAAPSGTAAYLIGGETLHSLLYLPVGKSKLDPLQGDRLQALQERFENVGILVIDEKSMIGQEVFSQVSQRLQEARPHACHLPFGGLSVILLGDWKQLPPVCDSSLYNDKAKKPMGYNLYQLFKDTIIFDQIQRQEGEEQKPFREELKRLGDGEFSLSDWHKWRARSLDLLPPGERKIFLKNGIYACALKKDMVDHNIRKVKENGEPVAPIFAETSPKGITKESSERACGLVDKIILSRKTVFRLTSNLWTKAGLTNGAVGVVHSIIYEQNVKPPSLPIAIIATFEDYIGPSYLPHIPRSVPICPVKRDWMTNKVHCSRVMLPIILGYALSIHKLQGTTCDKVILNPGEKEFASGLLLVGASRTKTYQGLAFNPFPNFERFEQVRKSKSMKQRLKEEERLAKLENVTLVKYQNIINR